MRFLIVLTTIIASLSACKTKDPDMPVESSATEQKIIGADKDSYGCIPSAGYVWCLRTKQCERPWELSEKKEFENSQIIFDKYCDTPTK